METIKTEEGLLAALSSTRRYLEFMNDSPEDEWADESFAIWDDTTRPRTLIAWVDWDLAEEWSLRFDLGDPHWGPWSDTWHLPEFWP